MVYLGYIGMCCPKELGSLSRFGLKTDIDGLKYGIVFKGITRVYRNIFARNNVQCEKLEMMHEQKNLINLLTSLDKVMFL